MEDSSTSAVEEQERAVAFLAIVSSHPRLTVPELETLGELLHLPREALWRCAIALNHLPFLEHTNPLFGNKDLILAAEFGFLEIVKYLMGKKQPDRQDSMITIGDYSAFEKAAANGHLDIVKYLVDKVEGTPRALYTVEREAPPEDDGLRVEASTPRLEQMFAGLNQPPGPAQQGALSGMFYAASEAGHIGVVKYLVEKAPPRQLEEMLFRPAGLSSFTKVIRRGHLELVQYLVGVFYTRVPRSVLGGLRTVSYSFRNNDNFSDASAHDGMLPYLLTLPSFFSSVEEHYQERPVQRRAIIYAFMEAQITALRTEKEAFEVQRPNAVFDITDTPGAPPKAELYFYFIRHLIRSNAEHPDNIEHIRFLLDIPSVKTFVRQEASIGNSLLRLALRLNHQEIAGLLWRIPELREAADAHANYWHELRAGYNVQDMVNNRESSMLALSQAEQKRIERLETRYTSLLKEQGIPEVMKTLKALLEERYRAHPATVQKRQADGRLTSIPLPLDYHSWIALASTLSESERQSALKAYYQHPEHTALRYLSKPNFWMHPQAAYVNRQESAGAAAEQWSSFDEYRDFISLLYLAASDPETLCDEYTVETRIQAFIREIAHIGRAHNWDKTRTRTKEGRVISEEYDDLEGDRPSCYSGVKRRLFQSLLGHHLLKPLSTELISSELRQMVRAHWMSLINEGNWKQIHNAWSKWCFEGVFDESLKLLDISAQQQKVFMDYLSSKYGSAFREDPSLVAYVEKDFVLSEENKAHCLSFGYIDLMQILEQKRPEKEKVLGIINQLIENISGNAQSTRSGCFKFGTRDKINQLTAIRDWYEQAAASLGGTDHQKAQFALCMIKQVVHIRRNPLGFYTPHSVHEFDQQMKLEQLSLDEPSISAALSSSELALLKYTGVIADRLLTEHYTAFNSVDLGRQDRLA